MKAAWAHTAARQVKLESGAVKHHGGVSVGVHPILSRYAVPKGEIQDRRNWGRYCGIKPSGERRPNEDGQRSDHRTVRTNDQRGHTTRRKREKERCGVCR
jgi:hypothetical protein